MNIGAASDVSSSLIQQATAMKSGQVKTAIQTAVLKQAIDHQQTAAESIIQMIESTTPVLTGGHVDIRV